jgi:hypothetical protein
MTLLSRDEEEDTCLSASQGSETKEEDTHDIKQVCKRKGSLTISLEEDLTVTPRQQEWEKTDSQEETFKRGY